MTLTEKKPKRFCHLGFGNFYLSFRLFYRFLKLLLFRPLRQFILHILEETQKRSNTDYRCRDFRDCRGSRSPSRGSPTR